MSKMSEILLKEHKIQQQQQKKHIGAYHRFTELTYKVYDYMHNNIKVPRVLHPQVAMEIIMLDADYIQILYSRILL